MIYVLVWNLKVTSCNAEKSLGNLYVSYNMFYNEIVSDRRVLLWIINFYNKMCSNTIKIWIKKYATIEVAVIDDFIRKPKM
jgi:hypothetical protein